MHAKDKALLGTTGALGVLVGTSVGSLAAAGFYAARTGREVERSGQALDWRKPISISVKDFCKNRASLQGIRVEFDDVIGLTVSPAEPSRANPYALVGLRSNQLNLDLLVVVDSELLEEKGLRSNRAYLGHFKIIGAEYGIDPSNLGIELGKQFYVSEIKFDPNSVNEQARP